tara:strand:+ start:122 stop:325 length:204 start_codon:yes stop_codon:yes gene_type:complete
MKQKQIVYSFNYEYTNDRFSHKYLQWNVILKINNKTFQGMGQTKYIAKLICIKNAEEEMYSLVSVKN